MATKCPKCGGEIVQASPEIAKCKNCGASFKRKAQVLQNETGKNVKKKKGGGCLKPILICFVIICVIGVIVGMSEDKPKKVATDDNDMEQVTDRVMDDSENKLESEEGIFTIGETAELNDVQVTLTNYSESNGSEWNEPADGKVFVLVEFEILNNSESELAISSVLSFEAYVDDYAANVSLEALIENEQTQLDGTIASGKKMRGWIGYEVPTDWKNLEIHFTDNVWSSNKFKFLVTK